MSGKTWMHRAAYAVMRRDVFNDGNSYDYDYPIESVFLTRDAAEWHIAALINDMRKTDEYDDYLDDELFDIVEVPLVTALGEEINK
jgi:hypothetical protein